MTARPLSWVTISKANIVHNVSTLRRIIGPERVYCAVVKSNAYGHGMKETGKLLVDAGADWLGVNALFEAAELKKVGITVPIYVMGYIPLEDLEEAVGLGVHFVVYNLETLQKLATVTSRLGKPAYTHLKVETGNYRQGVMREDFPVFFQLYRSNPDIRLEGVATHFANIEDTTDHSYARKQIEAFSELVTEVTKAGFKPEYRHCANSAATILFPDTYFNFVRTGVANYGLWPSETTYISALQEHKAIELKPILMWKTRIAQIKKVPAGSYVGYGCSYKTTHESRLAVLPVGYYDGYVRKYSNSAYVLICGKRAPVRGRVAMNMTVVDVSDIPEAALEDEVVLLGSQGEEKITAEQLAGFAETINYEVTTRIIERVERRVVD